VAGIVAALEAHNVVRAFCKKVDYLSFSFVAPLGPDDSAYGHWAVHLDGLFQRL
jgi:hypothetical protein